MLADFLNYFTVVFSTIVATKMTSQCIASVQFSSIQFQIAVLHYTGGLVQLLIAPDQLRYKQDTINLPLCTRQVLKTFICKSHRHTDTTDKLIGLRRWSGRSAHRGTVLQQGPSEHPCSDFRHVTVPYKSSYYYYYCYYY